MVGPEPFVATKTKTLGNLRLNFQLREMSRAIGLTRLSVVRVTALCGDVLMVFQQFVVVNQGKIWFY